jgi:MEMO1 family protein
MKKILLATLALAVLTIAAPHAACKKSAGPAAKATPTIQEPAVAGMFYPADRAALKKEVDAALAAAPAKSFDGQIIGLVAPHAGYPYSGPVAAAAFRQLVGRRYARVVVMAPSHRVGFYGAALSTKDLYRTPLGDIPIDTAAVKELLAKNAWASDDPRPYAVEHALEVELPFLQTVLPGAKLVPMIIGQGGAEVLGKIADALNAAFPSGDTLFVASTDLSHYHPYADAVERDRKTVGLICEGTPEKYLEAVKADEAELCGSSPVYILKRIAAKRGATLSLIEYANSGDTAGDKTKVVGYAAIAAVVPGAPADPPAATLSDAQKRALLLLARGTVDAYVTKRPLPPLPKDPALKTDGAAFVTLKKHGELRGCIGQITATGPLDQTVQQMAIAAASEDPRFPPVQPAELMDIDLEVSVLTAPQPLPDPMAVRVGTDGLIIEKGFHRGVLLPQVPTEQGWNREQYLEGIARKAGLPPDGWKGAKLERFQAIVFGEKQ